MIDFTFEPKTTLEEALMQLFTLVSLLRSENGCPWDREQTNKSVATNLLDETYEYIDAVLEADEAGQREELGDVLLNAMMLVEMHEESQSNAAIDSLNEVCEKLVRRHPHVFGSHRVESSDQVINLWNTIKVEIEGKTSHQDDFFSRVPSSLPPLEMANEIQKKIRKVGFDWPEVEGVFTKVKEELDEVMHAQQHPEDRNEDVEMELGDLLFAVVNLARFLGYNPSVALHRSNQKMRMRFNTLHRLAKQRNINLGADNLEAMDALWNEVKQSEVMS
jgi:MazG family protein